MRGAPILAGALLVAGGVSACSTPVDVTGAAGEPTVESTGTAVGAATSPPVELPAEVLAGLPPCPDADPDAAPVPGGLPDVTLPCLGPGDPVALPGLSGTPVIINAWASWCTPCRQELPALAAYAREVGQDVLVLGLNASDDPGSAAALWMDLDMPFASVVDGDAATRADLRWVGLPMTFFVDAGGRIVARHPGAVTDVAEWRELTATHLGVS